MNGRCQKDALDRADDICELCGNQYCAQCLLFPRGHRNPPTCKTCALQNSGLRGGSTKHNPISRREYKKRKKQLLEELENVGVQQPAIEFFELRDPSEFDQSTELDRRAVVIQEEQTIDILATSEDALPIPAPPDAPAPPPPSAALAAEPLPTITDQAISGFAPVDTSINPLALGGTPTPAPPASEPATASAPTESEASASAAELLARLKADQPIHSQFAAAPASIEADPFAVTPTSDLVARAPQAPPLQPAPAPDSNPFAPSAPETAAPTSDSNPFAPSAPAPAPAPEPARPTEQPVAATSARIRPKSEPWSPPAPPPRGSNLDGIGGSTSVLDEPEVRGAPSESQDAAPEDSQDRRKADTDESGQWIPPSLRGMAAQDEREPLPKRR